MFVALVGPFLCACRNARQKVSRWNLFRAYFQPVGVLTRNTVGIALAGRWSFGRICKAFSLQFMLGVAGQGSVGVSSQSPPPFCSNGYDYEQPESRKQEQKGKVDKHRARCIHHVQGSRPRARVGQPSLTERFREVLPGLTMPAASAAARMLLCWPCWNCSQMSGYSSDKRDDNVSLCVLLSCLITNWDRAFPVPLVFVVNGLRPAFALRAFLASTSYTSL